MKRNFANVAVFVLFFGLALVEAVRNQNWFESAIFLILGILFLWADFKR